LWRCLLMHYGWPWSGCFSFQYFSFCIRKNDVTKMSQRTNEQMKKINQSSNQSVHRSINPLVRLIPSIHSFIHPSIYPFIYPSIINIKYKYSEHAAKTHYIRTNRNVYYSAKQIKHEFPKLKATTDEFTK